jgi:hypothetical protein
MASKELVLFHRLSARCRKNHVTAG